MPTWDETLSPPGQLLLAVIVIFSTVLHELAHGYSALYFGDDTAKRRGLLTFNPLAFGVFNIVVLPIVTSLSGYVPMAFAWTYVNTANLEPRQLGEVVVALAGVTMNLLCAVALAILAGLVTQPMIGLVLYWGILANCLLIFVNLVPIPPLDGSRVVENFLPDDIRNQIRSIGLYGILIILFLQRTPFYASVINPPTRWLTEHLLLITSAVFRAVHGGGG